MRDLTAKACFRFRHPAVVADPEILTNTIYHHLQLLKHLLLTADQYVSMGKNVTKSQYLVLMCLWQRIMLEEERRAY